MRDFNKVMLMGRLGNNPVLKATQKGVTVTRFSVATSIGSRERPETVWHNVVTWAKQAENCSLYLRKGSPVFIEGVLKTRRYEKNGQTHYWTEVHAGDVTFLAGRTGGGNAEAGGGATRTSELRDGSESVSEIRTVENHLSGVSDDDMAPEGDLAEPIPLEDAGIRAA